VILTYRSSRTEAEAVVKEILRLGRHAVALPLDVEIASTFPDFVVKVRDALKTFRKERFDFLINNAGIGVYANFAETTESQFDQLVNSHLKGTFFLTQKLLPLIRVTIPGSMRSGLKYPAACRFSRILKRRTMLSLPIASARRAASRKSVQRNIISLIA
jgi:NAD(P)-dependent dehydrogenase (short-subunit alcohol dehydrogenase family)